MTTKWLYMMRVVAGRVCSNRMAQHRYYLQPLTLSENGRPVLLHEEVELGSQEGVDVWLGNNCTDLVGGTAVATSHRLFWLGPGGGERLYMDLAAVENAESGPGSIFVPSSKVYFRMSRQWRPAHAGPGPAPQEEVLLKFKFKSASCRKDFLAHVTSAMERRFWEAHQGAGKGGQQPRYGGEGLSSMGVAGIMRQEEKQILANDHSIKTAFSDLKALMGQAADMVTLANRFVENEKRRSSREDPGSRQERVELEGMLTDIGIASPVTKDSVGSRYTEELAREICDTLGKAVARAGGVMLLTDAFCLINRARGIALVSPEDIYRSCVMMDQLGLSLRLHRFDSGVLAIQVATRSTGEVTRHIVELVEKQGSITAVEYSQKDKIPVILAKEQLAMAEKAAALCRDESVEGVRFYKNIFV